MDPMTIGGGGPYGLPLFILILWSLAIRAKARGANHVQPPDPRPPSVSLSRRSGRAEPGW
jgi:hypothetical protein